MENFRKINKRGGPFIWQLRVRGASWPDAVRGDHRAAHHQTLPCAPFPAGDAAAAVHARVVFSLSPTSSSYAAAASYPKGSAFAQATVPPFACRVRFDPPVGYVAAKDVIEASAVFLLAYFVR